MKSFIDFINEEVKIHGNLGAPEDFLKDIETKAQRELGVRMDDPQDKRRVGGELMGLINTSRRLMFGGLTPAQISERVAQLQDLAKEVIMSQYADVLNNVDLDIKLVPSVMAAMPEITQQPPTAPEREQRRESENIEDERPKDEFKKEEETKDKKKSFLDNLLGGKKKEEPKKKENFLKTIEYKQKIDKAKLINNIIQGEAKNTKNILHSEEVKEGLRRIFGRQSDEIFRTWDQITKVADKLDWAWDIESKAQAMAGAPEHMAGAVKVDWPEAEEAQAQEQDEEGLKPDVSPEKWKDSAKSAEDILKKIEQGEDIDDQKEEISELLSNGNPRIFAVGIDFPMLLHETVKGIYELIAAAYLPSQDASKSEISKAKVVKMGTSTFEDEAEDFRYGPYIASALRDFVNSCPGVDRYPNMREFVFGRMVLLPEGEFLDLMKGIFQKTDKAKKSITEMISEIISEIREWEVGEIDEPQYQEPEQEPTEEEDEISKLIRQTQQDPVAEEEKDIKYMTPQELKAYVSTLTKKQLQEIIDGALDSGDYATLGKIQPYVKESSEWKMYGSEIKRLLKS